MKLGKKRIFDNKFFKKNIDINKFTIWEFKKILLKGTFKNCLISAKKDLKFTQKPSLNKYEGRKDFKCERNTEMPIS